MTWIRTTDAILPLGHQSIHCVHMPIVNWNGKRFDSLAGRTLFVCTSVFRLGASRVCRLWSLQDVSELIHSLARDHTPVRLSDPSSFLRSAAFWYCTPGHLCSQNDVSFCELPKTWFLHFSFSSPYHFKVSYSSKSRKSIYHAMIDGRWTYLQQIWLHSKSRYQQLRWIVQT